MHTTSLRALTAATALAWAGLLTAEPAGAQQPPPPAQAQPPAQAAEVDDQKLQTFAAANDEIAQITQETNQRLQTTQSQEDAQRIQAEAHQAMVHAVENAGLTVEEYNRIAQAVQSDPELRQRLDELTRS